jgi:hypothetical protein
MFDVVMIVCISLHKYNHIHAHASPRWYNLCISLTMDDIGEQIEILLVLHAAYVLQKNVRNFTARSHEYHPTCHDFPNKQVTLSGGLGETTIDIILSVIMIGVTCIVFLFCILHGMSSW